MGAGPSDQDISLAGGGGGQVYSLARQFLVLRAAAAPATLLMSVGQGVFRGMKDMKTPLKITLWANALNFGLDGVLILGLGWGVVGAGVATSVAEWVAAVAYLVALYEKRELLGAGGYGGVYGTVTGMITKLTRDDRSTSSDDSNSTNRGGRKSELGSFVKVGTAVVLRTALLLGTKTAASATAARLGAVPMAGHQVTMQLWILSSFALDSLAVAGQALVAVEIGKRNGNVAREIGDRLLLLGVGSGAVIAIVATILQPGVIPGAFTDDRHVVDAAMEILPLATVMLPINAAVYVLDGILVGCADFKFLALAMLGAAGVACGLLFNVVEPEGGLIGVWEALALLMVCRFISLVWRYQWRYGPLPPIQDDRT
jgi:Na+-driven multidrug efflux pump